MTRDSSLTPRVPLPPLSLTSFAPLSKSLLPPSNSSEQYTQTSDSILKSLSESSYTFGTQFLLLLVSPPDPSNTSSSSGSDDGAHGLRVEAYGSEALREMVGETFTKDVKEKAEETCRVFIERGRREEEAEWLEGEAVERKESGQNDGDEVLGRGERTDHLLRSRGLDVEGEGERGNLDCSVRQKAIATEGFQARDSDAAEEDDDAFALLGWNGDEEQEADDPTADRPTPTTQLGHLSSSRPDPVSQPSSPSLLNPTTSVPIPIDAIAIFTDQPAVAVEAIDNEGVAEEAEDAFLLMGWTGGEDAEEAEDMEPRPEAPVSHLKSHANTNPSITSVPAAPPSPVSTSINPTSASTSSLEGRQGEEEGDEEGAEGEGNLSFLFGDDQQESRVVEEPKQKTMDDDDADDDGLLLAGWAGNEDDGEDISNISALSNANQKPNFPKSTSDSSSPPLPLPLPVSPSASSTATAERPSLHHPIFAPSAPYAYPPQDQPAYKFPPSDVPAYRYPPPPSEAKLLLVEAEGGEPVDARESPLEDVDGGSGLIDDKAPPPLPGSGSETVAIIGRMVEEGSERIEDREGSVDVDEDVTSRLDPDAGAGGMILGDDEMEEVGHAPCTSSELVRQSPSLSKDELIAQQPAVPLSFPSNHPITASSSSPSSHARQQPHPSSPSFPSYPSSLKPSPNPPQIKLEHSPPPPLLSSHTNEPYDLYHQSYDDDDHDPINDFSPSPPLRAHLVIPPNPFLPVASTIVKLESAPSAIALSSPRHTRSSRTSTHPQPLEHVQPSVAKEHKRKRRPQTPPLNSFEDVSNTTPRARHDANESSEEKSSERGSKRKRMKSQTRSAPTKTVTFLSPEKERVWDTASDDLDVSLGRTGEKRCRMVETAAETRKVAKGKKTGGVVDDTSSTSASPLPIASITTIINSTVLNATGTVNQVDLPDSARHQSLSPTTAEGHPSLRDRAEQRAAADPAFFDFGPDGSDVEVVSDFEDVPTPTLSPAPSPPAVAQTQLPTNHVICPPPRFHFAPQTSHLSIPATTSPPTLNSNNLLTRSILPLRPSFSSSSLHTSTTTTTTITTPPPHYQHPPNPFPVPKSKLPDFVSDPAVRDGIRTTQAVIPGPS